MRRRKVIETAWLQEHIPYGQQATLATALGRSQTLVSRAMKGERLLPAKHRDAVASFLGIHADTIPLVFDTKPTEVAPSLPGGNFPSPPSPIHTSATQEARMDRWAVRAYGIVLGLEDDDQPLAVAELRRWSAERVTRKEPPESPAGRAVHRKRR